jgi:hypothetical protein
VACSRAGQFRSHERSASPTLASWAFCFSRRWSSDCVWRKSPTRNCSMGLVDGGPGAVVDAEQITGAEVAGVHPAVGGEEGVAERGADDVGRHRGGGSRVGSSFGRCPLELSFPASLRRRESNLDFRETAAAFFDSLPVALNDAIVFGSQGNHCFRVCDSHLIQGDKQSHLSAGQLVSLLPLPQCRFEGLDLPFDQMATMLPKSLTLLADPHQVWQPTELNLFWA